LAEFSTPVKIQKICFTAVKKTENMLHCSENKENENMHFISSIFLKISFLSI
jgi:hypothetical protein